MKICFLCDWDFTFLWEKIAHNLIENKVSTEAIGVVVGRNFYEYLNNKDNVVFKKIWLLQDITQNVDITQFSIAKLKMIEKKYGVPSLGRFVWADRSFVHDEFRVLGVRIINTFHFFENLFKVNRTDLMVIIELLY